MVALMNRSDDTPDVKARAALQRIAAFSVLAGLCHAIPIPFVDDLALRFIRKRAIRSELARGKISVGQAQMDVYLGKSTKFMGCLVAVLIYPVKKLIKKLLFVITIKNCVEDASFTFHELWLIRHAIVSKQLTQDKLTVEVDALIPLRKAIEATTKQIDTSPVHHLLRRGFSNSKAMVKQAGISLGALIRRGGGSSRDPDAVERTVDKMGSGQMGQLNAIADDFGGKMWADRAYLSAVQRAFDENFSRSDPNG